MFCLVRVFVKHKQGLNSPAMKVLGQLPGDYCVLLAASPKVSNLLLTLGRTSTVRTNCELRAEKLMSRLAAQEPSGGETLLCLVVALLENRAFNLNFQVQVLQFGRIKRENRQ